VTDLRRIQPDNIRIKMLLMLLASIGITAALLVTLYALSSLILTIPTLNVPLAWVVNNIGRSRLWSWLA
jgi:hypothetical protein